MHAHRRSYMTQNTAKLFESIYKHTRSHPNKYSTSQQEEFLYGRSTLLEIAAKRNFLQTIPKQ